MAKIKAPVWRKFTNIASPIKYDLYNMAKEFVTESMTRKIELKPAVFDVSVIKKYFPRLRYTELSNYCSTRAKDACGGIGGFNSISDIVLYDKSLILATISFPPDASRCVPFITLKTFSDRRSVTAMYRLRDAIKADTVEYRKTLDKTLCFKYEYSSWHPNYSVKRRTFEDTFMTDEAKSKLFHGVESFLSRKDWYIKHNLPYHYGILLYGPPGTGKTTIIQALANKYNFVPFMSDRNTLDCMRQLDDMSSDDDEYMTHTKLFIIEDIDSFSFASDRDVENIQKATMNKLNSTSDDVTADEIMGEIRERKRCRKDMSKFLNSLDGIGAAENIVYIFTTNNIGAIDPAVKRAGRLDLILEIGYVTDETLDDFLVYHFGKHLPEKVHVKPNQIFADIQLDVMQGTDFDQIVNKYTIQEV